MTPTGITEAESLRRRAIQLDPGNFDARNMLAEIGKENGRCIDEAQPPLDEAMVEALAHRIATLSSTGIQVAIRRFDIIRRKGIALNMSSGGAGHARDH